MSTCACSCACCKQRDPAAGGAGACCPSQKKCGCPCRCCQNGDKATRTRGACGVTRIEEETLFAPSEDPVSKVTRERVIIEGDDGKATSTETECRTMFALSPAEPLVTSDVTITSGEGESKKSCGKCSCVCCSDASCACACPCCQGKTPTGRCCRKSEGQTETGDKRSLADCKKCPCCAGTDGACKCPCPCCATCSCSCACCKGKKKCSCCSAEQGRCSCSCTCCTKKECHCCKCCTTACACDCGCCRASGNKPSACECDCACCGRKTGGEDTGACSRCPSKKSSAQKGAPIGDGERGREERLGTARHRERKANDERSDSETHEACCHREKMCTTEGDETDSRPQFSSVPSDFVKILTCKTGEKVILRRMNVTDYAAVRALLPSVSRCPDTLTEAKVASILSLPVFFAWCCFSVKNAEIEGRDEREAEGDLLGYCEVILQPHLGRKPDGRLERVVVSEHFRGRGLATKLCEAVIQELRERDLCGRLDLTVEKPEARHIYEEKLGFQAIETTVLRLQF
ncbi:UNVERIFIED_CONTAM: acetyltransferase, GNAT family protein [Hammondia hammondi]|eukprot:XP_008884331.1 acetyltransferase, GNAT family protein [Hammondia hammondi]